MVQRNIHCGPLSMLLPTVNIANLTTAEPGQVWGPRIIPDCQFIFVISGEAVLKLGPNEYKAAAGDCLFFGADSPHVFFVSKDHATTFSSIHFSWNEPSPQPMSPVSRFSYLKAEELQAEPRSYTIQVDGYGDFVFPNHMTIPSLENMFMQMVREYRFEEHGYDFVLRGMLIHLITVMIRHEINGKHPTAIRRKIAPALESIRKQPNISWSSSELADICGYHPTYFAELFRESTGYSPKHYLVLERIRKAKRLLLEAESIDAVSEKLGYTSVHYFCRNFKSVTGLTPTEFKRQSIEL